MPRSTPLQPDAANDPAGPDTVAESFVLHFPAGTDPFAHLEPAPAAEDCIPYAEAQRLMAIARAQGDAALTPAQHNAIWDCLLAQPASHAWLQAQMKSLQDDMAQRGLQPLPD